MNAEHEWDALSDLWRASRDEVGAARLRRMIASHRRRLAAVVAVEALLVAGFAWVSWLFVRDGVAPWEAVWLTTLWIFTAIAAPFAWWNRRGAWHAMSGSVAEYLRDRSARRMRSRRFGFALFVAEVIVVVAELAWFGRLTVAAALFLGVFTAAFAAWAAWITRQADREMAMARDER